jgi:hypothetical protein
MIGSETELIAGVLWTAACRLRRRSRLLRRYSDSPGQRLSQALQGLFAKSHVESEPRASISVSDSEKSQARDLYLKGRYEWNQWTPDSLNRALDYFTRAIVHEP